jgi:ELP3 family radical SAM enzyme/protein acetyltransferase
MSVVIHGGKKTKYTDAELDEKAALANLERTFEFHSYIPVMLPNSIPIADEITTGIILDMIQTNEYNKDKYLKKWHANPSRLHLYTKYVEMVKTKQIQQVPALETQLKSSKERSHSGVLVFTLLMSDKPFKFDDNGVKRIQRFTCKHNCYYCPNEPNMSRSYISTEPAVKRGDSFNWDPVAQIINRVKSYIATGQISAFIPTTIKGEFILEGGTYSSYPIEYRGWFMNQIYYACNTIYDANPRREMHDLPTEMKINETCMGIRVVGLSIETRPDDFQDAAIGAQDAYAPNLCKELRTYGVTKVQIGVQHTNDTILRGVNRGCTTAQVKTAMRILLNNGFKVQIHLMPDLPGSSPLEDIRMFEEIFSSEEYGFDHLKVYPTMVVNFTKIKDWYDAGKYKPYGDNNADMLAVLVEMTKLLNKYERFDIRKERIIRDIPTFEIEGGTSDAGMGNTLMQECKKLGINCVCIRCREIKGDSHFDPVLVVRRRMMCGALDYFISFESSDYSKIYGFLRLRLPADNAGVDCFAGSELVAKTSIIRELHVYGTAASVDSHLDVSQNANVNVQNRGLGAKLVAEAERITLLHGYSAISVIAGNGVKEYFAKKNGFMDGRYYMQKGVLPLSNPMKN